MTKICPDCDAEVLSTSQPSRMGTTPVQEELYMRFDGEKPPTSGVMAYDGCYPQSDYPSTLSIALAATPAVGGKDLRKQIAEINIDQDKHSEGNLQYVLIRGFSAMGWSQPTLASNDALDAIATLAQPAYPLRGRDDLIEKCAKISDPWPGFQLQDDSPDRDFAVVGCRTEIAASIRALKSASPPEQPAADLVTEWQPIETAPKDGAWILVWERGTSDKFYPAEIARFRTPFWRSSADKIVDAVSWQPAPIGPTAPAKETQA